MLLDRFGRARGVRRAWRTLKAETRILAQHERTVLTTRLPPGPLKVQVGSGPNSKTGWVNVDLDSRADLRLDLREPLPLPTGSAEVVFGEHFFEHLAHPEETARFLAECKRILQPGGVIKLAVPDAAQVLRAYVNGESELFDHALRVGWHPESCRTRMDQVNWMFRQDGEHQYAWDAETLLIALTDAGFRDACERNFDPQLDSEDRRIGGLLVQARAPG